MKLFYAFRSFFARHRLRFMLSAVALGTLVVGACFFFPWDNYRYNRGVRLLEEGATSKAIKSLSRLRDSTFEHYYQAQSMLFDLYLETHDSLRAAQAIVRAVEQRDWADEEVYEIYGTLLEYGDLAPYIARDSKAAAAFYATSDKDDHINHAAELYFDAQIYDRSLETYQKCATPSERMMGNVGLIYLFGWGGMDRDFVVAYDLLCSAPLSLPYVLYRADLMLRQTKDLDPFARLKHLRQTKTFYKIAFELNPHNEAVQARYEILVKLVEVYSDKKVSETGEISTWGCRVDLPKGRLSLGEFSSGQNEVLQGLGIEISDEAFSVGRFEQGRLVCGTREWVHGEVWRGEFNPEDGSIVSGRKEDIYHRVKQVIN